MHGLGGGPFAGLSDGGIPLQSSGVLPVIDLRLLGLVASLIDFMIGASNMMLPDRNTIPHVVAFFQNFRTLMPEVCHKHGALAIGGMTALFPSRTDAELNERALKVLKQDKKNEADCLMDGAWTGHPDQNEIAVA